MHGLVALLLYLKRVKEEVCIGVNVCPSSDNNYGVHWFLMTNPSFNAVI